MSNLPKVCTADIKRGDLVVFPRGKKKQRRFEAAEVYAVTETRVRVLWRDNGSLRFSYIKPDGIKRIGGGLLDE